jgi:hypothetical protein
MGKKPVDGDKPIRPKAGRAKRKGHRSRTTWSKGKSGNPKGRTPLPADYKLALDDLGPRGLQALSNIIDDPSYPRHEQACEYVLNRWKGTPTVKTEMSGPGGGPIAVKTVLTSDEKRARFRQLAEKAAGLEAARLAADAAEEERGNSD